MAVEGGVDSAEYGATVLQGREEGHQPVDLAGSGLEQFVVVDSEHLGEGTLGEEGACRSNLFLKGRGEQDGVGWLGLPGTRQHGGLGGEDFGKVALDPDDFESKVGRNEGEEGADDLDGLAAMGWEPGVIPHQ